MIAVGCTYSQMRCVPSRPGRLQAGQPGVACTERHRHFAPGAAAAFASPPAPPPCPRRFRRCRRKRRTCSGRARGSACAHGSAASCRGPRFVVFGFGGRGGLQPPGLRLLRARQGAADEAPGAFRRGGRRGGGAPGGGPAALRRHDAAAGLRGQPIRGRPPHFAKCNICKLLIYVSLQSIFNAFPKLASCRVFSFHVWLPVRLRCTAAPGRGGPPRKGAAAPVRGGASGKRKSNVAKARR